VGSPTRIADVADPQPSDSLAKFAEEHGLSFAASASLPAQGSTLSAGGTVDGAASGKLTGDLDATLARYSYVHTTTDADNRTHSETRHFTFVVTQLPESIGFIPYLGFSGPSSNFSPFAGSNETEGVDLGEDKALDSSHACAYKGASKSWLTQLFSPSLLDWLARSDDDFGFELANGVLCAGRSSRITDQGGLETAWDDAGHLAGAIRKECMEEVESGDAAADSAEEVGADDPRMEAALAKANVPSPTAVDSAAGAFNSVLLEAPSTYWSGFLRAFVIWLLINLFGSAITINVVVQASSAITGLIVAEVALLLLLFFFTLRSVVRGRSAKYAVEAFYRAYAADRKLKLEPPLKFAATHAEAKLPFKPDRVFTGTLPGGLEGSLALSGDGSKRSDRIAMVAGPRGPFAEDELQPEASGITAKLLDSYVERLEEAVTAPQSG
jgi:hypothetical protein